MSDTFNIKIGNDPENIYDAFPANREFKKRAENDNPGGGWPSDLPKPSVGGYGYTEQGEQVLVDDENVLTEFVSDDLSHGMFAEHFDIVDGVYSVLFDGVAYELNSVEVEAGGIKKYIIGRMSDDPYHPYDFSTFPFLIVDTPDGARLFTPTAGTHAVTVKTIADTVHKIDEKYLPEGGFGWTEQGNQTVITWDGDTEGVEVLDIPGITLYKVSDLTPNQSDLIGGIVRAGNGSEYYDVELSESYFQEIAENLVNFSMGVVVMIDNLRIEDEESGVVFTIPHKGIYFTKRGSTYVMSLTYGTPDTIHKIDEKYLPDKEIVVKVTYDAENDEWVSDKTYQELNAYANAGVNIKCFLYKGSIVTVCNLMSYIGGEEI